MRSHKIICHINYFRGVTLQLDWALKMWIRLLFKNLSIFFTNKHKKIYADDYHKTESMLLNLILISIGIIVFLQKNEF